MVRNGIYNLIGQLLKLVSAVLLMPIIIKYLGLEIFGLLSWTTAILVGIQQAEGGLSAGLLYFLSEDSLLENTREIEAKQNKILTSGIILLLASITLAVILLLIASPPLINTIKNLNILQRYEIKATLYFGAILVALRILQSLFWAILQSLHLYKTYSIISTIQIVANNIAWAMAAFWGERYLPNFIIISIILSGTINIFLCFYVLKLYPNFKWSPSKNFIVVMLKYNIDVWGSNVGSILFSQGDKVIVASTLGIETLSIYTIFTNVVTQINQFAAQAVHPLLPLLRSSSFDLTDRSRKIIATVKKLFLLNIYISIGGAGTIIILAKPILSFFLNKNFSTEYILPFQLLAFIYGLYTLSVTGYYIQLSTGNTRKVMNLTLFASISTLTIMYFSSTLMVVVLSNACFLFLLVMLFEAMKDIGITLGEWLNLLITPLTILTLFTSVLIASRENNIYFLAMIESGFILGISLFCTSKYFKIIRQPTS